MGDTIYALIILIILALFIGVLVGSGIEKRIWHIDAIKHSYGQYCPDTGRFAWKDKCGVDK
jgi:hypothetical protein